MHHIIKARTWSHFLSDSLFVRNFLWLIKVSGNNKAISVKCFVSHHPLSPGFLSRESGSVGREKKNKKKKKKNGKKKKFEVRQPGS